MRSDQETMRFFLTMPYLILIFLASSIAITHAKVVSITSSKNLVTGENCYVTYVVETTTSAPDLKRITVKEALFQIHDTNVTSRQGKRYYWMTYRFNSPNAGTFTIPATSFSATNSQNLSEPITLTVRDKNSLTKNTTNSSPVKPPNNTILRKTYPYYTQLIAEKTALFPNEAIHLEYKIYLPKTIKVEQWGLPSGDKKNATAWRFETPDPRSPNGDVVIDGINYQVGRYHTTVSGTSAGKAILGPFKARVVHNASILSPRGSFAIETQEMFPVSEKLELDILQLPANPPADFKGDVGNFQMSVNIDSKSELKTTESIKAEVTLIGRGKFSEITPPTLTNDKNWKLISQTKRDLGELRKKINAFAEFTYLIQPSSSSPAGATTSPGFSFSYLDPDLKAYLTLSYPGVPVTIKPSSDTNTVTSGINEISNPANPSDQMLGVIQGNIFLGKPWYKNLPLYLIHIIPAIICIILLLRYAYRKHQAIKLNQSHKIIQRKSITDLELKEDASFIKSACNYIQRWMDYDKHPELKEIPQLRDEQCYKPNEKIKLSKKRKKSIIATLKKLTILLFLITPQISDANAESLWKEGNYSEALTQYQAKLPSDSADLLYNIGNCHQKINDPGKAALFYHRALLLDPYHSRAKHNLSLVQNQNNSVISKEIIKSGSIQDWISMLSHTTYYVTFSLSIWLIVIAFLWLKILKPSYNPNLVVTLAILVFLTTSLSGYGYFMHPDKEKITGLPFAIIAKNSSLTEQPITNSERITTAPAASECHIISSRGTYTYLELADQTRGWILSENILPVIEK